MINFENFQNGIYLNSAPNCIGDKLASALVGGAGNVLSSITEGLFAEHKAKVNWKYQNPSNQSRTA